MNCSKATLSMVVASVLMMGLVAGASSFDPSAGLVGHWALDETSGTVAVDSSASGNNGTVYGGAWASEGMIAGALSFDGLDDYVITPGDGSIDFGTGSFSLSLWLKTSIGGEKYYIANNRTGGLAEAVSIRSWNDSRVQMVTQDDDGHVTVLSVPDANFIKGEWVHVAAVRDVTADKLFIYADGVLQGSITDNSVAGVNPMTDGLAFGVDTDGWIRYFSGLLDDIRIYNYALDQNDVRALYVLSALSTKATCPAPANNAAEAAQDTILSWTPGISAAWHDVYFGDCFDDVNDANTTVTLGAYKNRQNLGANTYDPCGPLEMGRTYYWRIDEVNEAHPNSPSRGDVWSFTVVNYVVLEDVESYNDGNNLIYDTWVDVRRNNTGAFLGLGDSAANPVHGGLQSMIFEYDTDDPWSYKYAEIHLPFTGTQDWTASDLKALGLWFYGSSGNDANETEQMYVGAEDAGGFYAEVRYGQGSAGEEMNDIKLPEWQQWNIELRDFNEGGVDLADVNRLYIGFGNRDSPVPGGWGTVYFDDIRLYICRSGGLDGDISGDCVVDLRDLAVMAAEWLGAGNLSMDLCEDGIVDFKDYSLLGDNWLREQLWLADDAPAGYEPGLAWVQFHSADFQRPADVGVDSQVNVDTGTSINDYSRIWLGLLKVPTNAEVTVEAETDDGLRLWIGDECIIDGWYLGGERAGTFTGGKGELLPIRLEYYQNGGQAFMRLYWSWACRQKELIPASAFLHTQSDAEWVQGVYEGEIPVQLYEDKSSIYAAGMEANEPMPIRPGPHLFIGDYLIESSQNIIREVRQPQRDPNIPNPIVTGLEDWCFQPYLTVMRDPNYEPNSFRIWYGAHTEDFDLGLSHIGYMESPDGINWVRPALILDPYTIQFGCSVIDMGPAHPNLPQRYKFGYYYSGGLRIGVSPDGIAWQMLVPYTVLSQNHDINSIFWDPLRNCYVATISFYTTGEKWSGNRRVPLQSYSDDLISWMIPWYVLTPDDSSDEGETQFYAMDGYLIRGPLKIGMVKVLRDDLVAEGPVDPTAYGIGYTTLAWTLDGEHWVRDQQVFFDRDHETDPIPWDHAHAWIDEQLIVDDEVYLYYGGYKQGHKVNRFEERQIGLVKMPLDRYVARKAQGGTPGTLLTVPMIMDDQPGLLVVNADASAGTLRVQVRDANSNQVIDGLNFDDCSPITTDGLSLEVHWPTEEQTLLKLAALANQTIKLEFELMDAELFAFDFIRP
ncbi:MAG TPA: LamG-like jellyroll fold domain-containing protein [Sedimentisphaerales bacterium]|nr:LamG-like jellyroll fold domain-containing protein [Sedimentisphaerales bacterium]